MKRLFQSAWVGAVTILIIGCVIGASAMGIYVHYRLNQLIEPAIAANDMLNKVTSDDLLIQTLREKFQLSDEQLERVRAELKTELPLRSLMLLEALPILNRPKYITFRLIVDELPPAKRQEFLKFVAETITKKRPKVLGDLYLAILPTSAQYEAIEAAQSLEIQKRNLPTDDIEKAALMLIYQTKDSIAATLTPEQQKIFADFLAAHPNSAKATSGQAAVN